MSKRRIFLAAAAALILLLSCVLAGMFFLYGPSLACLRPADGPASAGTTGRRIISGGGKRCYLLHVPPEYDQDRPLPVVISLHGFQSKPELHRFITKWDELADVETFLAVFPQGSSFPLRWNTGPSSNIEAIDDVQFISDLIADVAEIAAVDLTRVYVAGFSNGGVMAHRLACELADKVTAVGIVSAWGAVLPGGCEPTRPVPVIAFFGTADPQGDYDGGEETVSGLVARLFNLPAGRRAYPSVETWVEGWVERNGCDGEPKTMGIAGDVRGTHYSGCDDDADVVLYTIEGGGHTWPGGPQLPFFGKTSRDIGASAAMWKFFEGCTSD